jgi:hypothetical protein
MHRLARGICLSGGKSSLCRGPSRRALGTVPLHPGLCRYQRFDGEERNRELAERRWAMMTVVVSGLVGLLLGVLQCGLFSIDGKREPRAPSEPTQIRKQP